MATYYVKNGGSDAANGSSDELAWGTCNRVITQTLSAGDIVLFKRGDKWRELLEMTESGSDGNPITFGAYGTGENPIIDGSSIITTWSDYGSNVWYAALTTEPYQVFFNGIRGSKQSSLGNINAENEWRWESNVLYIYSTTDPDTAYVNPGIEASIRWRAIEGFNNISNIIIENITVQKAKLTGILFNTTGTYSTRNITIRNCVGLDNYWDAFAIENATGAQTDNILVTHCVGYNNGRNGFLAINCTTGSNRITVQYCKFYNNGLIIDTYGMGVYSNLGSRSTKVTFRYNEVYNQNMVTSEGNGMMFDDNTEDNIAEYNYIHDNEGGGIAANHNGDNNIVRYNLIVNNAKSGISGNGTGHADIYNNTVYRTSGSASHGIYIFTGGDYNIKNNIVVGDYTYGISDVDNQCTEVCTNNLFYGYTTGMSNYVTQSDNLTSDPLFVSTTDFHLQSGSPARNAGTNVSLTKDIDGHVVGSTPDMGCYEYGSYAFGMKI